MKTQNVVEKAGLAAAVAMAMPLVAFAQNQNPGPSSAGIEGIVTNTVLPILNAIIPLLIALAVVFFLYQLTMYVLKAGAEKQAALGRMIWGIIAIAVMVSVWGLVGILQSTFGLSNGQPLPVPATNFSIQHYQ